MDYSFSLSKPKPALVLDLGESLTKIGFTGEATPRQIMRTNLCGLESKPTYTSAEVSMTKRSTSALSEAAWLDALNMFLRRVYFHELHVTPKDHYVIICEHSYWPYKFKSALARALFQLGTPLLHFVNSAILPMFACGLRSGLVVDVGHNETRVTPVFEGYPIMNALRSTPLGAVTVIQQFGALLRAHLIDSKQASLVGSLNASVLENMMSFACCCHSSEQDAKLPDVKYTLSSSHISIPGAIRGSSANALFGEAQDLEHPSLGEVVAESLLSCPLDVRLVLCRHVVLTGGGASLPGFGVALTEDIGRRLRLPRFASQAQLTEDVSVIEGMWRPGFLTWTGGSLYGSLEIPSSHMLSHKQFTAKGVSDWSLCPYPTESDKRGEPSKQKDQLGFDSQLSENLDPSFLQYLSNSLNS